VRTKLQCDNGKLISLIISTKIILTFLVKSVKSANNFEKQENIAYLIFWRSRKAYFLSCPKWLTNFALLRDGWRRVISSSAF